VQQDSQTRRRVRLSEDEKRRVLEAWKKSGLSARAFGSREGVKASYLWRWKRVLGERVVSREVKARGSITFAPVHVAKSESSMTSERVQAEVVLGGELRVRVFEGADIVQVSRLIHALVGGAAC
jgi:transposase-like protein